MDTSKMLELFTAAKPSLLAMDAATVLRPRITRERAAQLTTILRREFEPLEPHLDEELSPARAAARRADLQALEPNALIFYAAELEVEDPWTSQKKERRAYLVKAVRGHDEMLSGWAVPLFKDDEKIRAQVADILRGRGIRDDAEDTIRWAALYRKHWAHAEGMTPVTLAYLSSAEAEATELLQMLDAAEKEEKLESPRDLRRRAYTRWLASYQEIFHLGRYLLRADPDAAQRFPAISSERGEPTETKTEEPKPADTKPAKPA